MRNIPDRNPDLTEYDDTLFGAAYAELVDSDIETGVTVSLPGPDALPIGGNNVPDSRLELTYLRFQQGVNAIHLDVEVDDGLTPDAEFTPGTQQGADHLLKYKDTASWADIITVLAADTDFTAVFKTPVNADVKFPGTNAGNVNDVPNGSADGHYSLAGGTQAKSTYVRVDSEGPCLVAVASATPANDDESRYLHAGEAEIVVPAGLKLYGKQLGTTADGSIRGWRFSTVL